MITVLLLLPEPEAQGNMQIQIPSISIPVFSPKPKIPSNAIINGIRVGGMTEEKAAQTLARFLPSSVETEPFVITYAPKELTLKPEEIRAQWKITEAVAQAMAGLAPAIHVELGVDRSGLRQRLIDFFQPMGGIYAPSGFWVEGEMPDVDAMEESRQTLVLNVGSAGLALDVEEIIDQIIGAMENGVFQLEIEETQERREPQPLDLERVFSQTAIPPINPDLDRATLEVIPSKPGYGFNRSEAAQLIETAQPGASIRLPMVYLDPELTEADVWFQDTLGYCVTLHTDNENRNENLRLACSKLDGIILQPGETISYNLALGQRTAAAGFKPAPAYSGVELVDEIGGGICQVSSTLYLSALFAELTVVERRNHGFPANYIPLGLDATVNWGTTDLKLRNDYDLPVKILAEVSDGSVKVRIMGVEQRDYYVKMEYRVDDHPSYAAAFRCRYDRQTDEEIYRSLDHTSIYLEDVWCMPGYAENAQDE